MDIIEALKLVKEQISLCEQTGDMFELPELGNAQVDMSDLPIRGQIYCIMNITSYWRMETQFASTTAQRTNVELFKQIQTGVS